VEAGGALFLVTAGHASAETNRDSHIHYRDPRGNAQWVVLRNFMQGSGNPWMK
jgi:hypothetical protein